MKAKTLTQTNLAMSNDRWRWLSYFMQYNLLTIGKVGSIIVYGKKTTFEGSLLNFLAIPRISVDKSLIVLHLSKLWLLATFAPHSSEAQHTTLLQRHITISSCVWQQTHVRLSAEVSKRGDMAVKTFWYNVIAKVWWNQVNWIMLIAAAKANAGGKRRIWDDFMNV